MQHVGLPTFESLRKTSFRSRGQEQAGFQMTAPWLGIVKFQWLEIRVGVRSVMQSDSCTIFMKVIS